MNTENDPTMYQNFINHIKELLGLGQYSLSDLSPEIQDHIHKAAEGLSSASSHLYDQKGDGHDIVVSENLMRSETYQLKAKDKSKKGGLTDAGRKRYNKATGSNLKRPQPEGGSRKKSFCARNAGQIKMHNIDCRSTPDKRACLARKRWKCGSMGKSQNLNKADLEHSSPQSHLKVIDPKKAGTGVDSKRNVSAHPISYFYFKGTKPESVVVDRGEHKYEVSVPDGHLYDLHTDDMGHVRKLHEDAQNRQVNQGVVTNDEIHDKLKAHGYKGFYHSGHQSLPNVVGLYVPTQTKERK